ncbi:MAG: isoamylase early set domain-containing protein [Gemmatimonadetes bacterium]|nr:isoamylase early set domain-containing protein [Gemmatimonadota bacterium]
MTDPGRISSDMHRLLDGEPGGSPEDRAAADRFQNALDTYAAALRLPGREVDMAVMAAVRRRRVVRAWLGMFWRWLVQPQAVQLRPAMAAVAIIAALAVGIVFRQATLGGNAGVGSETPVVLVRFELAAPRAQTVSLAGSFNDWSAGEEDMVKSSATGLWTITLPLPSGEHQYMFVVDGEQWVPDPNAHAQVDDGFGQSNSVIVVGPRGVVRS